MSDLGHRLNRDGSFVRLCRYRFTRGSFVGALAILNGAPANALAISFVLFSLFLGGAAIGAVLEMEVGARFISARVQCRLMIAESPIPVFGTPAASQSTGRVTRVRLPLLLLAAILIVAALLRSGTFYLPHAKGDQLFYTALALKLKTSGMTDYNLRGVDVIPHESGILTVQPAQAESKGTLLELLEGRHVSYYGRETLSAMPPLFPLLLCASHQLFGLFDNQLLIVSADLGRRAILLGPPLFFRAQFYSASINLALAVLLIGLTYRLGALAYDRIVALLAAALLAVNPVDLLTSQRIWADELLASCFALSALLIVRGMRSRSSGHLLVSGLACGLAIVTKGTGLFLLGINGIFIASSSLLFSTGLSAREKILFAVRAEIMFCLGALPFAFAWHGLVYAHYGTPIYLPKQEGITEVSAWFHELNQRNRAGQLYYFVELFPVFVLFYLEVARQLFGRSVTLERVYLILLPLGCIALLIWTNAREERYLLPAYPMIAVLAAAGLCRVVRGIARLRIRRWQTNVALGLVVCAILVVVSFNVVYGLGVAWSNTGLFPIR